MTARTMLLGSLLSVTLVVLCLSPALAEKALPASWSTVLPGAPLARHQATVGGAPTPRTIVVYGADTTAVERAAVAHLAAPSTPAATDTVSTSEVAAALQGTGLPVASGEKSLVSSILTCLNSGDGVAVRTENITRVTSAAYAGALSVAGADGVRLLIVAPPDNPVAGESALVGTLKALPQCQGNRPLDPARVRLAYKQIAWTAALAGPTGNLDQTASMLLKAEAPVAAAQSTDEAAVAAAIDQAARAENVTVDPALRPALIDFLLAFEHLGAGSGAAGSFTGVVEHTGQPLTVRVDGHDRQIVPAAHALVTRGGRPIALTQLHKGDRVTVDLNLDGTAERIGAAGSGLQSIRWLRWLVPLLALLVLVAIVALLLIRVRDDDFILEPDAPGIMPSPRSPYPGAAPHS